MVVSKSIFFAFCVAFCLYLCGCTSMGNARVWTEPGTSFADYEMMEMPPVANSTGLVLEEDVLATLTGNLKNRYKEEKLPISDAGKSLDKVLLVQTELLVYVAYEPDRSRWRTLLSGLGRTRCTLRTLLIDKATNQVVAVVVIDKSSPAGNTFAPPFGNYTKFPDAPAKLLDDVTTQTVAEVTKLMRFGSP